MSMNNMIVTCSNCGEGNELIECVNTYDYGWICYNCYEGLNEPAGIPDEPKV